MFFSTSRPRVWGQKEMSRSSSLLFYRAYTAGLAWIESLNQAVNLLACHLISWTILLVKKKTSQCLINCSAANVTSFGFHPEGSVMSSSPTPRGWREHSVGGYVRRQFVWSKSGDKLSRLFLQFPATCPCNQFCVGTAYVAMGWTSSGTRGRWKP